jgi:predicted DCC family thiol-disulfide oxidoreductase YuxK
VGHTTTAPPPRPTVLFDGKCVFCRAQARRLARFLPSDGVELVDFQEHGALDRFPGLSYDEAMRALQFVDARGRIFAGAEGVVRALVLRAIGKLALVYYLPGLRQLLDALYVRVAERRYRLAGASCPDGACALHIRAR